jgi:hypothetical protein
MLVRDSKERDWVFCKKKNQLMLKENKLLFWERRKNIADKPVNKKTSYIQLISELNVFTTALSWVRIKTKLRDVVLCSHSGQVLEGQRKKLS